MDLGRGENIESSLEKHRRSQSRYGEGNLLDNTQHISPPECTAQSRGGRGAQDIQGAPYEKKIGAQDNDMKSYLQERRRGDILSVQYMTPHRRENFLGDFSNK